MKKQIIYYDNPEWFKSAKGIANFIEAWAGEVIEANIELGNPAIKWSAKINELWVEEKSAKDIKEAIKLFTED